MGGEADPSRESSQAHSKPEIVGRAPIRSRIQDFRAFNDSDGIPSGIHPGGSGGERRSGDHPQI